MEFYSKDVQILRQSQIKIAFEYLQNEGIHVSVKELHQVTDVFVELCLRPLDDDLKNRVKALDKWVNDKKNGTIK
jgi:hypothetical protein